MCLLEKYNIRKSQVSVLVTHCYNGFIRHWKEPLKNILIEASQEIVQIGIETGSFEYVCYNVIDYCIYITLKGYNLKEFQPKYDAYRKLPVKLKQEYAFYYLEAFVKIPVNLLKEDYTDYHLLFGSQSEDDKLLNLWTQNNTFWLLFVSYTTKTWLFYLFKDYEQGLKTALLSEKYSESCTAYIISGANIFSTQL